MKPSYTINRTKQTTSLFPMTFGKNDILYEVLYSFVSRFGSMKPTSHSTNECIQVKPKWLCPNRYSNNIVVIEREIQNSKKHLTGQCIYSNENQKDLFNLYRTKRKISVKQFVEFVCSDEYGMR